MVATASGVTLVPLEYLAVALLQLYLSVEIDSAWIGSRDGKKSDEFHEGKATHQRAQFKAVADLSSSVNWFRLVISG